jgi:K+-transporting ATPase, c chain
MPYFQMEEACTGHIGGTMLRQCTSARERTMKEADVRALGQKHTKVCDLGFLGEPRVNVLELILDLDSVHPLR